MLSLPAHRSNRVWLVAVSLSCFTWSSTTSLTAEDYVPPTGQAWTASQVHGTPEPPPPYRTEQVYTKLKLNQPVVLTTAPGLHRWFAAELDGRIVSFPMDSDGSQDVDEFFNLREAIPGATRIYGMTFHPDFESNRLVYLCYITEANDPQGTQVCEFRVTTVDKHLRIDPDSKRPVISWQSGGHNGGCLKFGPDGMLYITTGDAASPNPPDSLTTGQDVSDLLAAILRIDVNTPQSLIGYSIPADNPFVDLDGARPEVWAFGFRNPWKMNFDPRTGELWTGDVGWELWEMVYRVERGGNYGWSIMEGPQSVRPETTPGPSPISPPVASHSHTESRSVTGGLVYYGERLPELQGAYIYGDYVTGKIWALRAEGSQLKWQQLLANSGLAIITFADDHDHELLIVSYDGSIHRLIPNPTPDLSGEFPRRLSQTGLFANVAQQVPEDGVFEYQINSQHWLDGSVSRRFAAIPPANPADPVLPKLTVYDQQNLQQGIVRGHWEFPADTVLVRSVGWPQANGQVHWIETQLLHRLGDEWQGYTYVWNESQSDAELAPRDGLLIPHPDQSADARHPAQWTIHSRSECMVCHTARAGTVLGLRYGQLDREVHTTPNDATNQLQLLASVGLIDIEEKRRPTSKTLPDPFDTAQPLEDRARSYLQTNCAHCHCRGGGGTAPFVLQYELPLDKLDLLNQRPTQGSFAIYRPAVVAAGAPYRSLLLYRMSTLGRGQMPHLGSGVVHQEALELIHDWIASLQSDDAPEAGRLAIDSLSDSEITQALQSTSDALRLAHAVGTARGERQTSLAEKIIARGMAADRDAVRGLFERFVPAAERPRRFGTQTSIAQILAIPGEVSRGRELFARTEGIQCRNCHRIGQTGKELGPALDGIAKRLNKTQLLESVLNPSQKIEPKYQTWLIETTQGRVVAGLIVEKTEDVVKLKQSDGKVLEVATSQIETLVPQQKSLMPELLLRDMTQQQVADLLAYLASLR